MRDRSSTPAFDGADSWSQNSTGMPGVAEPGDALGASVSALELYAVAGAG